VTNDQFRDVTKLIRMSNGKRETDIFRGSTLYIIAAIVITASGFYLASAPSIP